MTDVPDLQALAVEVAGEGEDGIAVALRVEPVAGTGHVEGEAAAGGEGAGGGAQGGLLLPAAGAGEQDVVRQDDRGEGSGRELRAGQAAIEERDGETFFGSTAAGDGEHRGGGVEGGDGVAVAGERQGDASRARAHLEDGAAVLGREGQPEIEVVAALAVDGVIPGGVDGVGVGGHRGSLLRAPPGAGLWGAGAGVRIATP